MNRATGAAAARATDRLLGSQKCNCHQALDAEKRILVARGFVTAAMLELLGAANGATERALDDCRRALAALGEA